MVPIAGGLRLAQAMKKADQINVERLAMKKADQVKVERIHVDGRLARIPHQGVR